MTLEELQSKYEAVLLCAPSLAADMADMVQDERANERKQCELLGDTYSFELAKHVNGDKSWFLEGYTKAIGHYQDAIRNRNEKEVG
jgi:hypothetical protein